MRYPNRVAHRIVRQALAGVLVVATLFGACSAQARDFGEVGHPAPGGSELQVVVPEGPANGAIANPAKGPALVSAPAGLGPVGLAPVSATAASLEDLVAATSVPAALTDELECLAGAVYFEAKSESLAGQLAVARVIVARSRSGRYPASYCGVVYQPSQFSFVRGRSMPAINHASRFWANAARIAQIADQGTWKSQVEGALFFHAARVSPSWGKTRLAAIGGHVFYR